MRFIALVSGGKDSCYALHRVASEGHELVGLANLVPPVDVEMDSYMFQTVGQKVVPLYGEALGVPCFQRTISGTPLDQSMDYTPGLGDEVEDLYELLKHIQSCIPFQAVSCGAIHSNYQRVRAENVCHRLGLKLLSPLWGRDQAQLLQEMIHFGIEAILIKVAGMGLDPNRHLGKSLEEMTHVLGKLNQRFGFNVCGEGGEYETLTLDAPLFQKKIVM